MKRRTDSYLEYLQTLTNSRGKEQNLTLGVLIDIGMSLAVIADALREEADMNAEIKRTIEQAADPIRTAVNYAEENQAQWGI